MTDVKDCTHDCEHSFRLTADGTKCVLCACILSPPVAPKPAAKSRATARATTTKRAATTRAGGKTK